jgi:hypothetical protein
MPKNPLIGQYVYTETGKMAAQITGEASPGFVVIEVMNSDGTLRGKTIVDVRSLANSPLFDTRDGLFKFMGWL